MVKNMSIVKTMNQQEVYSKAELINILTSMKDGKANVEKLAHKLAYSSLLFALPAPYGELDVTFISALVNNLPDSGRAGSLKKWVSDFTPYSWSDGKKKFTPKGKLDIKKLKIEMFHLQMAWENTYFAKPEAPKPNFAFDLKGILVDLEKQAGKIVRKLDNGLPTVTNADRKILTQELLASMQALVTKVEDIKAMEAITPDDLVNAVPVNAEA
jgi:hypothetical protein